MSIRLGLMHNANVWWCWLKYSLSGWWCVAEPCQDRSRNSNQILCGGNSPSNSAGIVCSLCALREEARLGTGSSVPVWTMEHVRGCSEVGQGYIVLWLGTNRESIEYTTAICWWNIRESRVKVNSSNSIENQIWMDHIPDIDNTLGYSFQDWWGHEIRFQV